MPELPSGTVTFLFTDIEGSTVLWERDRQAMADAVDRHFHLLRQAAATHTGIVFKVVGDAVQAAFPTAPDGIAAALDAQEVGRICIPPPSGCLSSVVEVDARIVVKRRLATPNRQGGDHGTYGIE